MPQNACHWEFFQRDHFMITVLDSKVYQLVLTTSRERLPCSSWVSHHLTDFWINWTQMTTSRSLSPATQEKKENTHTRIGQSDQLRITKWSSNTIRSTPKLATMEKSLTKIKIAQPHVNMPKNVKLAMTSRLKSSILPPQVSKAFLGHSLWDIRLSQENKFNAWVKTRSRSILSMVRDKSSQVLKLASITPHILLLKMVKSEKTQFHSLSWIFAIKLTQTERDASFTPTKWLSTLVVQLTSYQNCSSRSDSIQCQDW